MEMDKKSVNTSSGTLKDFIETCAHYRECKGHMTTIENTACKDPHEKVEKSKMAINVRFANTMDIASIEQTSATTPWPVIRVACDMNRRKECVTIVNIIDGFKQKDLAAMNKIEALSISFWSNNNSQSSKSKVSCTSGEGLVSK
eukprot:15365815-Ditylum_brightwellii.AAC.1